MSDYDDDTDSGFQRLIREVKEEAFHARRRLRRELPSPSVEAKRETAAALSDYRDVLWDYREEGVLEEAWDERPVNVDEVDRYLTEQTLVEKSMNRRGHAQNSEVAPLIDDIPAQNLFAIGKELDAIAKELGFAASTRDTTPDDDADMGDLRALLKARGQTEALENLPGSAPEDDGADGLEVDG